MGALCVEAGGVGVARRVPALVHVGAAHLAARAVEPGQAPALIRPCHVETHLVSTACKAVLLTLLNVLTQSLVDQGEALGAPTREGALGVDTGRHIPAAPVVHQTLVDVRAATNTVSGVTDLADAVVRARPVDANGIGVALPAHRALVLIHAAVAIAVEPGLTLAVEGGLDIGADGIGTAES